MTTIQLKTTIQAPIETVFNASRDIDLHINSVKRTKEKAIAGITSGMIGFHETVTWKGKHFGVYLTHQSKITAFQYPTYFVDEMIKGHFCSFKHQHIFTSYGTTTEMIDLVTYKLPLAFLGRILDYFILKKYLIRFLSQGKSI
ncbi:cell division protein [Flavobacteriaceae bacterium (ex Bugula neritina AB1)]|nr:cell division protein [Flavobacteriaceae bacterium (ex Bugula neritina AB1)]